MINQCTACHGSRIGEEYRGKHRDQIPGYKFDVHYGKNAQLGGKHCVNCHTGNEMHNGMGEERFAVSEMPRCEDCHGSVSEANVYHEEHWGELSCSVCHSQDYKNCNSCHPPTGLDTPSYLRFKIGKNPLPDSRSYEYVTLRHIPIAKDSFTGWGFPDLPEFNVMPTWKYAVPHNIQRWTARTDTTGGVSCSAVCHNSPATPEGFFLRQVDLNLLPDEAAANAPYIVPDTPPDQW
ncbi:MAG: cytochrome c3 family protein [Candidatus Eisenbacteria bacterium]|uniref:Cytochrome c3 family protein n=1 Tax=Eiseniibacteriota bacterium TaxID=2212470 RepID=A0A948RS32_UNCEI|nr:cytochrome c3 family protein [Candidatus Eisenbacteria bacterium]